MTIIAIALGAIAAVATYRRSQSKNPAATNDKVHQIRQSTSVVLAIGEALWAILDALIFLTKATGRSGGTVAPLRTNGGGSFGQRIAADTAEA